MYGGHELGLLRNSSVIMLQKRACRSIEGRFRIRMDEEARHSLHGDQYQVQLQANTTLTIKMSFNVRLGSQSLFNVSKQTAPVFSSTFGCHMRVLKVAFGGLIGKS